MLAAFRLIKEQADILHVNQFGGDVAIDALLSEASKHQKKMEESVNAFPQTETTEFPWSEIPVKRDRLDGPNSHV